jgi:phage I-like protein
MPNVLFIADAPDTILAAGEKKTSRAQLAKTGKFSDPRYGKFAITREQFQTWIKNFNALHRSDGREGLPVDVDHGPEKKGDTEAAGWVTSLDTMGKDGSTPTPDELWGTVEWNSLGVELVSDRRYVYLSPSYQHNFQDETGKTHGTALVGIGLTNRPFLTMATVSLSRHALAAEHVAPESDSSPTMPELSTNILTKLGLGADADEAQVLSAIEGLAKAPESKEDVSLDALAKAEGKVVLSAAESAKLLADAAAGRQALDALTSQRFETAFDKALSAGRAIPAQKDTYLKLYEADADATLSALDTAPVVLNMEPSGSGHQPDEGGVDLSTYRREAEGNQIDTDRARLAQKADQLLAENPTMSYDEAIMAASGSVA